MATVKECRDHANECERLALEATERSIQQSYLEIAQTWRNLADKLDRPSNAAAHAKNSH